MEKEAGIANKKAMDSALMGENVKMAGTIMRLRDVVTQQKHEINRLRGFVEKHDPHFCKVRARPCPRCHGLLAWATAVL